MKPVKTSMTVAEAGRKGGEKVRDERGTEFFEEIGRKGGRTVQATYALARRAAEIVDELESGEMSRDRVILNLKQAVPKARADGAV